MKTIVLTGLMGSGKTSVGKLLSKKLNLEFVDIDSCVELNEQTTITEIFKTKGEKYFRELEAKTIKELFHTENQIISLGGGAFENSEIRDFLNKNAVTIYLKTSPEIIFERIKNDSTRPLLCGNMNIEKIKKILELRLKNYESAQYTISTDNKTIEEIIEEITGAL